MDAKRSRKFRKGVPRLCVRGWTRAKEKGVPTGPGDGDMGRAQRLGLLKTSDAPVGSPCERGALIGQWCASLLRVPSSKTTAFRATK
jgi:hypothetical protein